MAIPSTTTTNLSSRSPATQALLKETTERLFPRSSGKLGDTHFPARDTVKSLLLHRLSFQQETPAKELDFPTISWVNNESDDDVSATSRVTNCLQEALALAQHFPEDFATRHHDLHENRPLKRRRLANAGSMVRSSAVQSSLFSLGSPASSSYCSRAATTAGCSSSGGELLRQKAPLLSSKITTSSSKNRPLALPRLDLHFNAKLHLEALIGAAQKAPTRDLPKLKCTVSPLA